MKEQPEKLDRKRIIAAIAPENRRVLAHLDIFESLDSTNTYLLKQKRESGWACLAEQQTSGRGRQGKKWFSPYATNIYCSLAWSFPPTFTGLSALSVVCGMLLIETLKQLGLEEGLGLKWPNDIYFSGRKLAGILLENRVSAQQNWVVMGVGLNLCLPAEKDPAWIDVEEILGRPLSRNLTAGLLLDTLLRGLPLFVAQGLKPFFASIQAHDLLFQKEVWIHTPKDSVRGLAQGFTEEGSLLLLTAEGKPLQFCYGEVSVRLTP